MWNEWGQSSSWRKTDHLLDVAVGRSLRAAQPPGDQPVVQARCPQAKGLAAAQFSQRFPWPAGIDAARARGRRFPPRNVVATYTWNDGGGIGGGNRGINVRIAHGQIGEWSLLDGRVPHAAKLERSGEMQGGNARDATGSRLSVHVAHGRFQGLDLCLKIRQS